jgi:hypothetical protein
MRQLTLLVALILIGSAGLADDADRIAKLESEVAELKQLVTSLQEKQVATSQQAPIRESEARSTPSLRVGGFGHTQYEFSDPNRSGGSATNHFTVGGLDLFFASQISDRWSFLGETLFEFEPNGENVLDVERLLIQFDYAEWLRISAGRGHLPLGFWNQRYHHGTFLQTTVDRPLVYRFEDDGGLLPIHFVGVELAGDIELPGSYLSYAVNVANGRGREADHVQLIEDRNDSKMWSLLFTLHPTAEEGVGLGANIVRDRIPSNAAAGRPFGVDETIVGAHAFFIRPNWEVILEGFWIDHEGDSVAPDFNHWGGFAQLSYSFGRLRPYYRFDFTDIARGDTFFAGLSEDLDQHTLGLRFDFNKFVASKFEYRRLRFDDEDANEAAAQLSFAF